MHRAMQGYTGTKLVVLAVCTVCGPAQVMWGQSKALQVPTGLHRLHVLCVGLCMQCRDCTAYISSGKDSIYHTPD